MYNSFLYLVLLQLPCPFCTHNTIHVIYIYIYIHHIHTTTTTTQCKLLYVQVVLGKRPPAQVAEGQGDRAPASIGASWNGKQQQRNLHMGTTTMHVSIFGSLWSCTTAVYFHLLCTHTVKINSAPLLHAFVCPCHSLFQQTLLSVWLQRSLPTYCQASGHRTSP